MTDLQKYNLMLLKEIDNICKKNDIEYCLAMGSCIGAVRNRGFLPWDDDVDIHMTLANAEKLIAIQDSFPRNRVLLYKKKEGFYPLFWWRYADVSTSAYARNTYCYEAPAAIFIDIFILDYFPVRSEEKMREIAGKYRLLLENEAKHFFIAKSKQYVDENVITGYISLRNGEDKTRLEDILYPVNKDLFSETGYYALRMPPYATDFVFLEAKLFFKKRMIKFEDTYLPIPYLAEEYLECIFGLCWWDIPDIANRRVHNFTGGMEWSYKALKDEFDKYNKKKEVLGLKINNKDLFIKRRQEAIRRFNMEMKWHTKTEHFRIENKLNDAGEDLKSIVKERNIRMLEDIFSGYYEMQFGLCYDYDAFFDICDEWLYAAFIPLLYRGKLSKVRNIFRLREKEKGIEMSSELSELRQFTADLEFITTNIFTYHNYREAREKIDSVGEEWAWQITLIRCDIRLALMEGKAADEIKTKLIRALEAYPRDGELLKYYADITYAEGNKDEAFMLYNKSLSTLTNGIVKHEIIGNNTYKEMRASSNEKSRKKRKYD